jgi:hypothetical protein
MSTYGISQRDAQAISAQLDEIEMSLRVLEQQAGPTEKESVRDIQSPLYGLPTEDDLGINGLVATPGISNVVISWQPPPQVLVRFYEIQISDTNDFTTFETFRTTNVRFEYRLET